MNELFMPNDTHTFTFDSPKPEPEEKGSWFPYIKNKED